MDQSIHVVVKYCRRLKRNANALVKANVLAISIMLLLVFTIFSKSNYMRLAKTQTDKTRIAMEPSISSLILRDHLLSSIILPNLNSSTESESSVMDSKIRNNAIKGSRQSIGRFVKKGAKEMYYASIWKKAISVANRISISECDLATLASIHDALCNAPITNVHFEERATGTQMKMTMTLSGGQKVIFKPARYKRSDIRPRNTGYDRHNGEIASYNINRVMGLHRAPIMVARKVKMDYLQQQSDEDMLTRIVKIGNKLCLNLTHISPTNAFIKGEQCEDEDGFIEGSVMLWLPLTMVPLTYEVNPWHSKQPKSRLDDLNCLILLKTRTVQYEMALDFVDTAIFDFLVSNADRHHVERAIGSFIIKNGSILLIDNGKSFGDPNYDNEDILLPLKQCCMIRSTLFRRLQDLNIAGAYTVLESVMRNSLVYSRHRIEPLITHDHLKALDRRLVTVLQYINACVKKVGSLDQILK